MRTFVTVCCGILLYLAGCRSVNVEKHADGSWAASYWSYGLWTTLGYLDVSVNTNGIATLKMNDLGSDVSTNHVTIVDSSGKVIAEITGDIIKSFVR